MVIVSICILEYHFSIKEFSDKYVELKTVILNESNPDTESHITCSSLCVAATLNDQILVLKLEYDRKGK